MHRVKDDLEPRVHTGADRDGTPGADDKEAGVEIGGQPEEILFVAADAVQQEQQRRMVLAAMRGSDAVHQRKRSHPGFPSLPLNECATMSLRSKVALILVVAIFAVLAVVTLLRAMERQRSYTVERTKEAITLTQTVAGLLMVQPGGLADSRIQGLVEEYGAAAGVLGVRVVDRNLTVVASSNAGETGRTYRPAGLVEAVRHGELTTEVHQAGRGMLGVALPLRGAEGALAGAVELRMDLSGRTSDLETFIRQGALAAALIAAVTSLLLVWILTFVVVRPVT
jgi:sensor histidine kinase regulating citrate/malate metabolism